MIFSSNAKKICNNLFINVSFNNMLFYKKPHGKSHSLHEKTLTNLIICVFETHRICPADQMGPTFAKFVRETWYSIFWLNKVICFFMGSINKNLLFNCLYYRYLLIFFYHCRNKPWLWLNFWVVCWTYFVNCEVIWTYFVIKNITLPKIKRKKWKINQFLKYREQ